MNATEARAKAAEYRKSASELRADAQYTDSAQARMQQENIARQHEVEAARHEVHANAIDAKTLAEVRKLLQQFNASTHISKQDVIEQITRLVGDA